jgi:hypothetical protein
LSLPRLPDRAAEEDRLQDTPLYAFPAPPAPDPSEWPGTPIGLSNTITRTKGRTAVHDKTVDSTPGLLDKLLTSAHNHMKRIEGQRPPFEHDVIIHGVRVRATTDSPHLYDFWVDNWYGVEEWQRLTGQAPSAQPRVRVYAFQGVKEEQEAAYYSYNSSTIIFFNTSYYGQLKSWVLGAVGRILAGEYGIHSIHGACVEKAGKGVLYIAPTGTGKSTSSYGLMTYPRTRFHSDDWVYVRYAYATRDGRRVLVLDAEGSDGSTARGYRVYRWIERHSEDAAARLSAMTLSNQQLELRLGDLDLAQQPAAYAYTSEKVFYLRTNLVENFPLAALEIIRSKEENVPDLSNGFLERYHSTVENILADLKAFHGKLHESVDGKSDRDLTEIAGRLIAFDNARSMLDISKVLPAERVFTNPMEPVRLAAVMLLKRDPDDSTVLNHLLLEPFMERLLIGETPDKKRETAYNAYRAVDDRAERGFIEGLAKQAGPSRPIYSLFAQAADVPASLEEEFELFRVMYNAARTYDLNTNLQRDPRVRDKREAVAQTLAIIARTVEQEPHSIRLSIENYRDYLP